MSEQLHQNEFQPEKNKPETTNNTPKNHNGFHAANDEIGKIIELHPLTNNSQSHEGTQENTVFTASSDTAPTPKIRETSRDKIIQVKRRGLIKTYWETYFKEQRIEEEKNPNLLKRRRLIKQTQRLDKAQQSGDFFELGNTQNKLKDEDLIKANSIIAKVDAKMDELKVKMDTGKLKPDEANDLYQGAIKEQLKFKNLKNLNQLHETIRELSDVYVLAGYTAEEAKRLARNTKISAALTIPSLWGSTALSGIVAYNSWSEGINFMATQDYSVQVSAAVAAHASLFYANHRVSKSNGRLFEATQFCPEVQVLGAHAVSSKILKDRKLARGAVNHLSHWMPRLVEEVPWLSLNFANPEAALPANLAATAVVGGRYFIQTGVAKYAERRNLQKPETNEEK